MKFLIALLSILTLTNCASVSTSAYDRLRATAEDEETGRLIVFRDHAMQASLAKAYIGLQSDEYVTALEQNQYAELVLPAGIHQLKTRAHGSTASSHAVALTSGKTTCVEVRPNSEDLGLIMVPFINALVPSFVFIDADCPSLATFAGYSNAL